MSDLTDNKRWLEVERIQRLERERQEVRRIWPDSNASLAGPAKLLAVRDACARYPAYRQQLLLRVAEVDALPDPRGVPSIEMAPGVVDDYNSWSRGFIDYDGPPLGGVPSEITWGQAPRGPSAFETQFQNAPVSFDALRALGGRMATAPENYIATAFDNTVKLQMQRIGFEERVASLEKVQSKPAQKAVPIAPTPGRRKIRLED